MGLLRGQCVQSSRFVRVESASCHQTRLESSVECQCGVSVRAEDCKHLHNVDGASEPREWQSDEWLRSSRDSACNGETVVLRDST